jgi:hypothetical protein
MAPHVRSIFSVGVDEETSGTQGERRNTYGTWRYALFTSVGGQKCLIENMLDEIFYRNTFLIFI